MTIYSNGPDFTIGFPQAAPLTRPLVQLAGGQMPGARLYAVNGDINAANAVRVTVNGHWYNLNADNEAGLWVCRGCATTGKTGQHLDAHGRCPRPPQAQDIADALLGRSAVAA